MSRRLRRRAVLCLSSSSISSRHPKREQPPVLKVAANILRLLATQPGEFRDRVSAILDSRLDRFRPKHHYAPELLEAVLKELGDGSGRSAISEDGALSALEDELRAKGRQLERHAPYPLSGSGDRVLGRLCYLACRRVRPSVVVETGVLYGNTSAYILEALAQNGAGVLHSVDLPPARDGSEDLVGCLVPERLRRRWRLYRGTSRRVLPRLLPSLSPVGLFVHDSLHTYRNMMWEFKAIDPYLADQAMIISDDVQTNAAFAKSFKAWPWAVVVSEPGTDALLGVASR
jgi:Methyltransferase domain